MAWLTVTRIRLADESVLISRNLFQFDDLSEQILTLASSYVCGLLQGMEDRLQSMIGVCGLPSDFVLDRTYGGNLMWH